MQAYYSNWAILFPIAFSLFIALRLSQASRDDGQRTTAVLIIRLIIVLLMLFAFFSIGVRTSVLSAVWGLMLIVLAIVFWWKNRRLDRSAMMLTIMNTETSDERQAVARAFYHGNYGFVRRRGLALYNLFSGGIAWANALELAGVSKTVYEKLAARQQYRYGMHDGNNEAVHGPMEIEQEVERMLGRLMIFSWVMVMFPVIAMFIVFIVPTFFQMFEEFGISLPPAMRLVIAVSNNFSNFGWSTLIAILPLVFFVFMIVAATIWIFPQLTRLPLLRWFSRDYYRNVGFTALSRASEMEPNMIQACYATAELVPVDFVAQRYRIAAELLGNGMKTTDAFLKAGLLSQREAKAIGFGLESQNPTWGLQQLAGWAVDRMLRRYSMLIQCVVVFVTLFLGLIVGAIAVGVLQSLAIMVIELAGTSR